MFGCLQSKMFFHIVSCDVCYCSQGRAGSWEGWYFSVWLLCQWPDISSHSWHLEFYNTFATTIRLFWFLTFSAICMFLTSPQTLWPTYGAIFLVFYQLVFFGCLQSWFPEWPEKCWRWYKWQTHISFVQQGDSRWHPNHPTSTTNPTPTECMYMLA